ncbi:MAG: indole-3-glycerol phosphate synthase TrpC [Candidatus Zixiibacteriota bacterium]
MSERLSSESKPPLVGPATGVLNAIVDAARRRAESLHSTSSVEELLRQGQRFPRRSLIAAIRNQCPAIIAEIKKASPSKGLLLKQALDPLGLAAVYACGGATALSVVTEPEFFLGENGWVTAIRQNTDLPILRKDFMVEPIQVAESAALGADAILLIARILTAMQLRELRDAAGAAQLEVLFEVHGTDDMEKVAACDPHLVGINARDLDDFSVDIARLARLCDRCPSGAVAIAESGISNADQIQSLMQVGFRGFLIGESLITSPDPAARLRELCSVGRQG